MDIDEETLKRNRKFAVMSGSLAGAILIGVVYFFVKRFPEHQLWGIAISSLIIISGQYMAARIWRRKK